jgi:hypothetical protein
LSPLIVYSKLSLSHAGLDFPADKVPSPTTQPRTFIRSNVLRQLKNRIQTIEPGQLSGEETFYIILKRYEVDSAGQLGGAYGGYRKPKSIYGPSTSCHMKFNLRLSLRRISRSEQSDCRGMSDAWEEEESFDVMHGFALEIERWNL